MKSMLARIGGAVEIGRPADFLRSEQAKEFLRRAGLFGLAGLSCAPFLSIWHSFPAPAAPEEILAFAWGLVVMLPLLRSRNWKALTVPSSVAIPVLIALACLVQQATGRAITPGLVTLWVAEMLWASMLMLGVSSLREQGAGTLDAQVVAGLVAFGIVVASTGNALLGIVQVLRLHALASYPGMFSSDGFASGFLAQRNQFADLQALALVSLPVARIGARRAWVLGTRTQMALGVLYVLAGSLSGSNAFALYLASMGLISVFWLTRIRSEEGARSARHVARLSLGGVVAFVFFKTLLQGAGVARHKASVGVLKTLWSFAFQSLRAHPWKGIGLGHVPSMYYEMAASLPQGVAYRAFHVQGWNNAHNVVLQMSLEFGVLGLALSVAWLGKVAQCIWKACDSTSIWGACVLVILGLHSMVEQPLWTLPFLGIAATCLGLCDPWRSSPLVNTPASRSASMLVFPAAALMALGALVTVQSAGEVDALTRAAQWGAKPANVALQARALREVSAYEGLQTLSAQALRPVADLTYESMPVALLDPSAWPSRQLALRRLMGFYPSGSVPMQRAELLALQGHERQAQIQATQACKAYPQEARRFLPQLRWLEARGFAVKPLINIIHKESRS